MTLRRTGLRRKSELRRGSELRRTPLARGKSLRVRSVQAARPRNTGPTPEQREQVINRSRGCCERCGCVIHPWTPYSIHHRLPRGRGGTNVLSNLVLLCGSATTPLGCHQQVESQRTAAYDTGWLVRTGHVPAERPVLVFGLGHVLISDDGCYRPWMV